MVKENISIPLKIKKYLIPNLFFLLVILLIGAYLRLYRISEYMTFLGDEGRDVLVVKRMIVDRKFTLLGPVVSLGGFFLGPIYYYFMLPFLWFWHLDPTGSAVMVALFGIATIFLVFKVGKDFFDEKVGLIASSLYALSPLVITHSHSSWNPNVVPFFAVFYIFTLGKLIEEERSFWWFLAGFTIGVGLQLHYLFSFLIPVGLFFILIFKRRASYLRKYGMIILGILMGWSPFLAFELRHRFPNTKTIINFLFGLNERKMVASKTIDLLTNLLFRLFGRLVFYFPSSEGLGLYPSPVIFWWKTVVVISIIGSFGALLLLIIRKKKVAHILLFLWLIFGIGLFSFYKGAIYDYYLGILFPLPFLLIGNLFCLLWQKNILKPLVGLGFIGLLVLNWSGRPFRLPPNRQLEQTKKIARFVLEKTEGRSFNFALITPQNSDHAYRYFLEIWGHPSTLIENPQIDPERKTVTNQLLVVCEDANCQPLGHPLWEIAGFGQAEIVGKWDVFVVKVYKLAHYQENEENDRDR